MTSVVLFIPRKGSEVGDQNAWKMTGNSRAICAKKTMDLPASVIENR
jgi:hypothetical protein